MLWQLSRRCLPGAFDERREDFVGCGPHGCRFGQATGAAMGELSPRGLRREGFDCGTRSAQVLAERSQDALGGFRGNKGPVSRIASVVARISLSVPKASILPA